MAVTKSRFEDGPNSQGQETAREAHTSRFWGRSYLGPPFSFWRPAIVAIQLGETERLRAAKIRMQWTRVPTAVPFGGSGPGRPCAAVALWVAPGGLGAFLNNGDFGSAAVD